MAHEACLLDSKDIFFHFCYAQMRHTRQIGSKDPRIHFLMQYESPKMSLRLERLHPILRSPVDTHIGFSDFLEN